MKGINDNDLLELYRKRDFNILAQCNLKTPIDGQGNTIIHLMAERFDKDALEALRQSNPKAISYDIINTPNHESELPIHLALGAIQKNGNKNYGFITYMVDILGANNNIPDNRNRIIVKNKDLVDQNDRNTRIMQTTQTTRLQELNQNIIQNIMDLSKSADKRMGEVHNTCKAFAIPSGKSPVSNLAATNYHRDFVIKLIDHYTNNMSPRTTQLGGVSGGYAGKRRIKNIFPVPHEITENSRNDSFLTKKQSSQYTGSIAGGAIGVNAASSNRRSQRQKKIDRDLDHLFSVQSRTIQDLNDDSDGALDENSDEESDEESVEADVDDDQLGGVRRDEKVNEIYRSFIQRIMDLLGVDAETARAYRSVLRLTVVKNNPELKNDDALRTKEIEKILENKQKLEDTLSKIDVDIDALKKQMKEWDALANERRKKWEEGKEKRRKEWEERKERRGKDGEERKEGRGKDGEERKERRGKDGEERKEKEEETKPAKSKKIEEIPSSPTTEITGPEPKKRAKKTTKVAENGYLQSDEIIFSPGY